MLPTPTGWFPDPWNPAGIRYWDGRDWTSLTALPAPPVKRPHPSLPVSAAWGAVVTLVLSLIASRYILEAIAGFKWPIFIYVAILAVLGYVPALLWCRYASGRWGSGNFRDDVGMKAKWVDAGWGPVTWVACVITEVVIAAVVVSFNIPFTSNVKHVDEIHVDRGYVVSLLVVAVVAAPVCEEIVFRGVVMRGLLSRTTGFPAVIVQGILFGMAHFDPVRGTGNIGLIMVLSGVGCVLGGAAYLVRRLAPTMIAHGIINALAMAIALSGWSSR